ncbi:ABC transporter ATP-binding protein [uncultured Pseudodesulfovibrio sp.]|uniref:energy-coupling factor ABC transporter ATP-binding protein n=1 Tax=uncultured Pseudodesulfovibrio sp. TaxID=2035858 RepID=UPI0029C81C52|nr:ABC transporter ATP-binding protein [uncultured Pseudodesulfovibrio sp.]
MAAISIDALSYSYPGSTQKALDAVSADIIAGEFVAVLGVNDAGKSTLCYALAGVIPHLLNGKIAGRVHVGESDIHVMNMADIASLVGLVMQVPGNQLSGVRFTVFEEIAFTLENRGVPREDIRQRVEQVLAATGLTDLADRSPQHLSGGQQQRVVLASMLVGDPAALVLDEPTTFLDPQGTRQVFEILGALRQQGKTIVIAEQKMEMVARYADRVLVLHEGKLVMNGPPAEVLVDPRMQEVGLDWTRYTKVAVLAKERQLWKEEHALPVTLSGTLAGLKVD